MNEVKWNEADKTPDVAKGEEVPYWIAVKNDKGKVYVFMAYYQNRPLEIDNNGEIINNYTLYDINGDPVGSDGWVDPKKHVDFDEFWEQINFNEHYELLGWAEYVPPTFKKP